MTFLTAYELLCTGLADRYSDGEARSIARILLEDAFQCKKPDDRLLSPDQEHRWQIVSKRLFAGEPVQYVLGEADFFGLKFKVSNQVLIPRQETEELVAWVLDWLKTAYARTSPVQILDIGSGSGCIGLSIQRNRPNTALWSMDYSPGALDIARQNAALLCPEKEQHWLLQDALSAETWLSLPQFQCIVSNPPYIPQQETALMPAHVLDFEPHLALFVSDSDPLIFYRTIAAQAKSHLVPGGALFFECNEFNATEVFDLMQHAGYYPVYLRKDLSGADRMVMGMTK